ncbi:hypothetical protein [Flavobacterium sp.]|uniref:hypothetical protein n=1 Tax=Flavobacterium sp. TaxID=239 RepID=UPI0039E4DAAE
MKAYKNLSKQSAVKAYQPYLDAIKIQFDDGTVYLFTHENSGEEIVSKMKALASEGQGLGSYIRSIGTETAQKL